MNTKLSDLSTTINSAIVDNKIVDAESKSVTSKLELYKTSVNEYQLAFDNALNSIIREIASSQAKDRLDEWKRTEFSTDSDGIIERVAGAKFDSKWTDTWRSTVNPAISKVQSSLNDTNNKISNLKTGGVNLLQSYREETKAVIDPSITSTKKLHLINCGLLLYINLIILEHTYSLILSILFHMKFKSTTLMEQKH
ncbi:hypothetical protein UM570_04035 [Staphylococcus aureus]|nr:hypothetical protein UM570_04035 [Staphylococcus aureus]